MWTGLLVGVAIAVALGVAAWMRSQQGGANSPQRLFGELARAHGLDRRATQLLLRVARTRRLKQPIQLFFEAHYLAPEGLPSSFAAHRDSLRSLRRILHGV